MKLRMISVFTLAVLALLATGAQANSISQYGIFPANGGGNAVIISSPGTDTQACTGPAGSTYAPSVGSPGSVGTGLAYGYSAGTSKHGNVGSACANLELSSPSYSPSDKTTTNEEFAFAQFNTDGGLYVLTDVQVQVYTYTVITSSANNTASSTQLSYNVQDEVLLSTSAPGSNSDASQDGSLADPFYDELLNTGAGGGQDSYVSHNVASGASSGTVTDYSSENPNATFNDQTDLGNGVTSNTFSAISGAGIASSYFEGTGTAPIYWQVLGTQTETGSTQAVISFSNYAATEIIVTYDYTMATQGTPEPTTLLLLGSGLSFVAMRLRRRSAAK